MQIKFLLFLLYLNIVCCQLQGQVAIGSKSPSPNAILDLVSPNKGFLIPRMSSLARNSINVLNFQDKGLQVFDTTTNSIWYWNGMSWINNSSLNYMGSSSIILNGNSFQRAPLSGDISATQNSNILTINDNAINSIKLSNHAVVTSKIAPGAPNSILKTNLLGLVEWTIDHSKIIDTKIGSRIATFFDKDSLAIPINESITSLSQNNTTGKITYLNESNIQQTASVVSSQVDNILEVGSDGGATLPLKIIDVYSNGTSQNITSTVTTLNLNTVRLSTSNIFSLNNNRITISEAGIYSIDYSVGSIITSLDEVSSRFWVEKNNIEIPFSNIFSHSYDNSNFCASRKLIVSLLVGDVIRIQMQRVNSINLSTIPSCSGLIIHKLN
jgi:hypothetical protein